MIVGCGEDGMLLAESSWRQGRRVAGFVESEQPAYREPRPRLLHVEIAPGWLSCPARAPGSWMCFWRFAPRDRAFGAAVRC